MFHKNLLLLHLGIFSSLVLVNYTHIFAGLFGFLESLGLDIFHVWILLPIFLCIVVLSFSSFLFLLICSLITNVKTGKPPIKNLHLIYKFNNIESLSLSSVCKTFKLFPYKDYIQICYERNFRPFGIAHGAAFPDLLDDITKTVSATNGYKTFEAKAVSNAIYISCPTLPWFSYFGVWLVLKIMYPKLYKYSKKNRLSAYPVVEIYRRYSVMLMVPLSRQDNFVVPEAEKYVVRSCSKLEESLSSTVTLDVTSSLRRSNSRAKSPSVVVLEQSQAIDNMNLESRYSMDNNCYVGLEQLSISESLDDMDLESRYRLQYNDVANNNIVKTESLFKHSTPKIGNGHTQQG